MGISFAAASHFQEKWIVTKNDVKIQQIKLIIMILCTSLNPKCYAAVLSSMCSLADNFFYLLQTFHSLSSQRQDSVQRKFFL